MYIHTHVYVNTSYAHAHLSQNYIFKCIYICLPYLKIRKILKAKCEGKKRKKCGWNICSAFCSVTIFFFLTLAKISPFLPC